MCRCPLHRTGTPRALRIRQYRNFSRSIWSRLVTRSVLHDLEELAPKLIHVQSRETWRRERGWPDSWGVRWFSPCTTFSVLRESFTGDPGVNTRIIAVSDAVKNHLLERNALPADSIVVVNSGVEIPAIASLNQVLEPSHTPVVGTAGPLEAEKGLPFFLGAAKRVLDAHQNVEFLVAGAGPEEMNLRRLARELEIGAHVTFISKLQNFSSSLAAMDVFCLPSLKQGLGTVMLEAMALGRPVIATGVGGVYSIVRDDQTGLVVPPSNSARLAERILELLNDPPRARRLGNAGRQLVQDLFNVERMMAQTVGIYEDILSRAEQSRPARL